MIKKLNSYAKINWFITIHSKKNNYHKLTSLISLINLNDEIGIRETKQNTSKCYFSGKFKLKVQSNTILKLLTLLKVSFPRLKDKNFNFYIKKNIPSGSGLGGASSNATAVFNYFVKKYKLKISKKDSKKLLEKIGKDCPLFLNTKTKLIKSFGESYMEIKKNPRAQMLLIKPRFHLSTKSVFDKNIIFNPAIKLTEKRLTNLGEVIKVSNSLGNDLLTAALKVEPSLKRTIKIIESLTEKEHYSMTGSGSTFFIIFNNKKALLNAQKIIKKQHRSYWAAIVNTI